jgi:hypothetical protein
VPLDTRAANNRRFSFPPSLYSEDDFVRPPLPVWCPVHAVDHLPADIPARRSILRASATRESVRLEQPQDASSNLSQQIGARALRPEGRMHIYQQDSVGVVIVIKLRRRERHCVGSCIRRKGRCW